MKKAFFLFILPIMVGMAGFSQGPGDGELKVIQDPRVDTLMSRYAEVNEIHPVIEGWRIEIFFEAGNYSKKLAMEARSEFVKNYPDIPSYLIFQQPYYKVRVGDYRTKMEAERFLHEIEPEYPQAFVVMDEINFPRLD